MSSVLVFSRIIPQQFLHPREPLIARFSSMPADQLLHDRRQVVSINKELLLQAPIPPSFGPFPSQYRLHAIEVVPPQPNSAPFLARIQVLCRRHVFRRIQADQSYSVVPSCRRRRRMHGWRRNKSHCWEVALEEPLPLEFMCDYRYLPGEGAGVCLEADKREQDILIRVGGICFGNQSTRIQ